jgi:MFS family permease
MSVAPSPIDELSPRYVGWRVVAVCYLGAVFCWGLGLYGHGVYLTELNRLHGWPTAWISGGITGFYLLTAALVVFISDAIAKLGPKRVMFSGMCCFAAAILLMAFVTQLWQLYLIYMLLAVGAASMHVGAISNVVGLWFHRKRPLALSLALNGASSGGILITPVLVLAIARYGITDVLVVAAAIMCVLLLPAIALWIGRPARAATGPSMTAKATWTRASALRSLRFWSVAAPFALGLTAQVGFLVHQIAILQPTMGRAQAGFSVAALTIMAILGRFGLGAFAERLDMRWFAAASVASQATALLAMTASTSASALLLACAVFGLSAGNLLTLPSLVIQREFDAASFGMLVGLSWAISQFTYAFGPGLLGVMRDWSGNYTLALVTCAALDLAAAVLILLRPASGRLRAT